MGYVSNRDVLYRRKSNPFKGRSTGTGYGYGSLASTLLKGYVKGSKSSKYSLKGKMKTRFTKPANRGMRKGLVHQEGSSSSVSKCNFGTNPKISKELRALTSPQRYVVNKAGVNTLSGIGLQSIFQVGGLGNADLAAIKAISPSTPTNSSRVAIESLSGELIMCNAASSTAVITIYDCIARRDGLSAASGDPVSAVIKGIDNEGGSGTDFGIIGSKPWESELFTQFYKIVQRTKAEIPSGGIHRHSMYWNPNHVLNNALQDESLYGIKDLSVYTMVYFHGQPEHDSTTTTSVTIGPASIDYVYSSDIKYRYVMESATDWSKSNNLATAFAVGAQFVNDLVGQVQDAAGLHPGTLIS